ncbi:DUF4867 family protein [Rossellomorea sp. GCM10028870]|uniref:DUF4867 family protein n=1 Tax=Rossellomorea sp. GCM10028870 TaxID=3273426 RepID=UPI0036239EC0
MVLIERLRVLNPSLIISDVRSSVFGRYGKVLGDFPLSPFEEWMAATSIPDEGNIYVPSVPAWEEEGVKGFLQNRYFGGMSIQIGYCNGRNSKLNGLEFHKGSEINVAMTDLVLLVGHMDNLKDTTFASDQVEAFFIPKGTAVELYQTTLHLAPCKVSADGFKCLVILPEGTNLPLSEDETRHDPLLFMKNKWLIAHEETERFVSKGAIAGIKGENVTVAFPESTSANS